MGKRLADDMSDAGHWNYKRIWRNGIPTYKWANGRELKMHPIVGRASARASLKNRASSRRRASQETTGTVPGTLPRSRISP